MPVGYEARRLRRVAGAAPLVCSSIAESVGAASAMVKIHLMLLASVCLLLGSCAAAENAEPETPRGCILLASYEQGTEESRRLWNYLQQSQQYLVDHDHDVFSAALWYSPGEGRAALEYLLDCDAARRRAQSAFEHFATDAPDSEIASLLRAANDTWTEISRDQMEDRPAGIE